MERIIFHQIQMNILTLIKMVWVTIPIPMMIMMDLQILRSKTMELTRLMLIRIMMGLMMETKEQLELTRMIPIPMMMAFLTVKMVSLLTRLKQQISIAMESPMIKMKMMMETMFLTPLKWHRDLIHAIPTPMEMDLTMEQRPYEKLTHLKPIPMGMDSSTVKTISHQILLKTPIPIKTGWGTIWTPTMTTTG